MFFIGFSESSAAYKPWHPTASECKTYYLSAGQAVPRPSSSVRIGSVLPAVMLFYGALFCGLLDWQSPPVTGTEIFRGFLSLAAVRSYIHGR